MGARLRLDQLPPAMQAQALAQLERQEAANLQPKFGLEPAPEDAHRMRQDRGPKLNKTEAAFASWLAAKFPALQVEREGVTLLLANGVRYTADFAVFNPGGDLVLYEVKGGKFWDDAVVKLKVAANKYPRIAFWLATPADRTKTTWKIERVFV